MALTFGFYNSHSGDRKYTADQLSGLFEGLITDGVYRTVGECFSSAPTGTVSPSGNPMVRVGTGRGYFNHHWVHNDAPINYEITNSAAAAGDRWDAIIFEVDNREAGARTISLKTITGTVDETDPQWPSMDSGIEDVFYHPILYIKRDAGSGNTITNDTAHIFNPIGTGPIDNPQYTPFVAGVVQSVSAEQIWNQWEVEFNDILDELREAISDVTSQTILPGSVGTNGLANGAVTVEKLDPSQRRYIYADISMTPSMFTQTDEYENYPYRGAIPLDANTKTTMVADVYFSMDELDLGVFAPITETYNGGVYVYAADISEITDDMTIPTIVVSGGVSV